jgi:uncharacterized protein YciI
MFVLELTYTASLERVGELIDDHLAWMDQQYVAGAFVVSGRKVPPDGGVILALGHDRSSIEDLVKTDPFAVADVCEYHITEFVASRVAPALEQYRETA